MSGEVAAQTQAARPLRALHLAALLLSLIAGVSTALAVMPAIFRATPTDISRVGVILEVLRAQEERPAVVVLGDSVAMSGIDARRMSEKLPGQPLAWNLASTGQSLVESSLISQELGDDVDSVIYIVRPRGVAKEIPLLPQKSNAYFLYGFRPDTSTLGMLSETYGEGVISVLSKNEIRQAFDGRWAVRQLIDTQLRIFLRRDLDLMSAEVDLFHPQRYTQEVDATTLVPVLDEMNRTLENHPPEVGSRKLQLLLRLADDRAAKGGSTVVVIPPLHPALLRSHGDAYARAIDEVEEALAGGRQMTVIDASRQLQEHHFIDQFHPNDAGAAVLSDFIAEALAHRGDGAD